MFSIVRRMSAGLVRILVGSVSKRLESVQVVLTDTSSKVGNFLVQLVAKVALRAILRIIVKCVIMTITGRVVVHRAYVSMVITLKTIKSVVVVAQRCQAA